MKTLSKSKTHISRIRKRNGLQISQVCALFDWDKQQYCDHQFATYLNFIELGWPAKNGNLGKYLRNNAEFCAFFVNEWIRRDKELFFPRAFEYLGDIIIVDQDGVRVCDDIVLAYGKFVLHLNAVEADEDTIDEPSVVRSIELTNDPLMDDIELRMLYKRIHSPSGLFCDDGFTKRLDHIIQRLISQ